jgi:hypothetical protein
LNRIFIPFFFIILLLQFSSRSSWECTQLPPEGISPFFSFDYTVLPKKLFVLSEEILFIKQNPHSAFVAYSEAYYGLTDNLTLLSILPVVSQKPEVKPGKKTGLGDFLIQANYKFYKNETDEYRYRIIGSGGIQFPTTTIMQNVFFNFPATSFILAITQDAITRHWYFYSNFEALLNLKHHQRQFGHVLFFDIGSGIIFCMGDNIFTILAECSDFYSRPDKINGIPDLTTGENFLLIGPSFRFKRNNFLIQGGIQFVVSHVARVETLDRIKYLAGVFASYAF